MVGCWWFVGRGINIQYSTMKMAALITFAVLALAFVTNPDDYKHRAAIEAKFAESAEIDLKKWYAQMLITQLVKSNFTYHDYIIISVCRLQGRVVTVGAFGQVFFIVNPKIGMI